MRKPTASDVHDWNKVVLSIGATMRELLSTDMVRAGYLVQVSRGRVSPGMGLDNEGPGQAGEDPPVVFHPGQTPWSATEGAPTWQREPVVRLPHLTEPGLGGLCACQMAARHVSENNHHEKFTGFSFLFFRFRLHSLLPSPEGTQTTSDGFNCL